MNVDLRSLRIAAHAELLSLTALFANLATVDDRTVAALVGPAHGCVYLFVVVAVLRAGPAGRATRATALIPGVGGLLAVRRLRRAAPATAVAADGKEAVRT